MEKRNAVGQHRTEVDEVARASEFGAVGNFDRVDGSDTPSEIRPISCRGKRHVEFQWVSVTRSRLGDQQRRLEITELIQTEAAPVESRLLRLI